MAAAHSRDRSASEEGHFAGPLRSHLHERSCDSFIKIICALVFALLLGNVWTGEPRLCYLVSVASLPQMQIADIL